MAKHAINTDFEAIGVTSVLASHKSKQLLAVFRLDLVHVVQDVLALASPTTVVDSAHLWSTSDDLFACCC